MKVEADKIRNFAVTGHSGSGKTTLCDCMLHKAGAVERFGRVDQKSSVSDYTTDEQEKLSSIYATSLNCAYKNHHLFFIDTPGYGEFIGETYSAMGAVDAVLVVLDGAGGIEVGAARAWKMAKDAGKPVMVLINRLDRERADFSAVLSQIQEVYGKTTCVPITMPLGSEADISGVVHVLRDKDIPGDISAEVAEYKEQLMDTIAESDEELMMRYLEGEELTEEEISTGLHKSVLSGDLVPVFAGSTEKEIGVEELMNGVINLLPGPLAKNETPLEEEGNLEIRRDGPGTALVFKSVVDPFIGQLTYMRVMSGEIKSDSEVHNTSNGGKERFGTLFIMNGKKQDSIEKAVPGTILAVPKLKDTGVNDTISTDPRQKELRKIQFPNPIMSYSITAAKSGEEEKIGTGLSKLSASDPTIRMERNAETHELLLSGMGDQHLAQVIKKLKETSKVEVNLAPPKIPYRETVTGSAEGHYRHKKQTGGHGQFAEVFLRIEPNPEGFEFANEVVGGNIPKNFIPAVEKGVVEAMEKGPLAGCLVQDVKVTVYDGKHHPVDSSEMAFKIAARTAFRNSMSNANPILLEPIQKVDILIPDEYMGDITGDLNHKRGRILGMNAEEGMQMVQAEIPLAEMSRYANELRSMTQGRGSFEMEFDHYEMVPSNIAKEIMDSYKAEEEEQ